MNPLRALCITALGVVCVAVARADPPPSAQVEINALLEEVGASGCGFYRNGSWYDAKRAQAHLTLKYRALAGRDRIATAEDFIALAATRSSLSGDRYWIRCPGSAVETSEQWLKERLLGNRARDAAGVSLAAPLVDSQGTR